MSVLGAWVLLISVAMLVEEDVSVLLGVVVLVEDVVSVLGVVLPVVPAMVVELSFDGVEAVELDVVSVAATLVSSVFLLVSVAALVEPDVELVEP